MYRENKEQPVTETRHPCLTKWRKRIDAAERADGFQPNDRSDAANWTMCAIGEAREAYGVRYYKDRYEGPLDKELRRLGQDFYIHILDDAFTSCRRIITLIEQRLAELA